MRWIAKQAVLFFAVIAAIPIYQLVKDTPVAIDVILCVSYTVLVFGDALVDRLLKRGVPKAPVPAARTLLTHIGFLLAAIAVIRVVFYVKPANIGWSPDPDGSINCYLLALVAVPLLISYLERALILTPRQGASQA